MDSLLSSTTNLAPGYLIFHYFWTYAITSTRPLKGYLGIDHNVAPREDIARFGEKSVEAGKMTRSQLNMLKRNEAAHHNTIEQFPLFFGSVLLGIAAKVPNESINRACLIYTVARIVYHVIYLRTERGAGAGLRSLVWWAGNLACLNLIWQCRGALDNVTVAGL